MGGREGGREDAHLQSAFECGGLFWPQGLAVLVAAYGFQVRGGREGGREREGEGERERERERERLEHKGAYIYIYTYMFTLTFWSKVLGEEEDIDGDSDLDDSTRVTEGGGVVRFSTRAAAPPRRLSAGSTATLPSFLTDDEGADPADQGAWTKAQLSALLSALQSFGYGRAEAFIALNPALENRSLAEVQSGADVCVVLALACVREQSEQDGDMLLDQEALTKYQTKARQLWHFLREGTPAEGPLLEPPAPRIRVPAALEGWLAQRIAARAPQLLAALLDLRRLRHAVEAANAGGSALVAPLLPSRVGKPSLLATEEEGEDGAEGEAEDEATSSGSRAATPLPSREWGGAEDTALLLGTHRHGMHNWAAALRDGALPALTGLALLKDASKPASAEPAEAGAMLVDPRQLSRRLRHLLAALPVVTPPTPATASSEEACLEGDRAGEAFVLGLYPSGYERPAPAMVGRQAPVLGGARRAEAESRAAERLKGKEERAAERVAAAEAKAREKMLKEDARVLSVVTTWLNELCHRAASRAVRHEEARRREAKARQAEADKLEAAERRKSLQLERAADREADKEAARSERERAKKYRGEDRARDATQRHRRAVRAAEERRLVYVDVAVGRDATGSFVPRLSFRFPDAPQVVATKLVEGMGRLLTEYDYRGDSHRFGRSHR